MLTLDTDKPEVQALKRKFKNLTMAPFAEQVKVFCTRYIFLLEEDGYAEVKDVAAEFERLCKFNEYELEMNHPNTTKFLEDNGHEFVSQSQKNEVFSVCDIDGNKRIALIEYLLFSYKPYILTDYYNRIGQEHRIPEDEDELFYRVDPDTGYALVSELFGPAFGKDGVLDKMTRSIAEDHSKREKEIEQLQAKLKSDSNVVRKGAEQRLRIIASEDTESAMNKRRASIKRRTNKIMAEQRRLILQYDRKTAEGNDKRFKTVVGKNSLPEGWSEYFDEESELPYYYNEKLNITQWDRPTQ